jgi:hypothetical protein
LPDDAYVLDNDHLADNALAYLGRFSQHPPLPSSETGLLVH